MISIFPDIAETNLSPDLGEFPRVVTSYQKLFPYHKLDNKPFLSQLLVLNAFKLLWELPVFPPKK